MLEHASAVGKPGCFGESQPWWHGSGRLRGWHSGKNADPSPNTRIIVVCPLLLAGGGRRPERTCKRSLQAVRLTDGLGVGLPIALKCRVFSQLGVDETGNHRTVDLFCDGRVGTKLNRKRRDL